MDQAVAIKRDADDPPNPPPHQDQGATPEEDEVGTGTKPLVIWNKYQVPAGGEILFSSPFPLKIGGASFSFEGCVRMEAHPKATLKIQAVKNLHEGFARGWNSLSDELRKFHLLWRSERHPPRHEHMKMHPAHYYIHRRPHSRIRPCPVKTRFEPWCFDAFPTHDTPNRRTSKGSLLQQEHIFHRCLLAERQGERVKVYLSISAVAAELSYSATRNDHPDHASPLGLPQAPS